MALRILLASTCIFATSLAVPSPNLLGELKEPVQGGSQKLVGTSFGIPGKDAEYDYVV